MHATSSKNAPQVAGLGSLHASHRLYPANPISSINSRAWPAVSMQFTGLLEQ